MTRPILVCALLLSAACSRIHLYPVSEPPPTRVAQVDDERDSIDISLGVALAVECVDSCDGNCRSDQIEVDDPSVVLVRKAYRFADTNGTDRSHNPATYVIAGLAVGTTELRVRSDCKKRTYHVTVLE